MTDRMPPFPLRPKTDDEWAEILVTSIGAEFPTPSAREYAKATVKFYLQYRDEHIERWGRG